MSYYDEVWRRWPELETELNELEADIVRLHAENEKLTARVAQLTGHLDWICWGTQGMDTVKAENEKLRALLVRWLTDVTGTHNINGQPISLVQDTYIALGREPLKPLGRE